MIGFLRRPWGTRAWLGDVAERLLRRLCPATRPAPPSWPPSGLLDALPRLGRSVGFSVVVVASRAEPAALAGTVLSLVGQTYGDWELLLVHDGPLSTAVQALVAPLAAGKERLRSVPVSEAEPFHVRAAAGTSAASGLFLMVLQPPDLLEADALAHFAASLLVHPDGDLVFADEGGDLCKPGWSPETLLGRNCLGRPAVLRRSLVDEVGGFRPGFDGADEYDLALRLTEVSPRVHHIPLTLLRRPRAVADATVAVDATADATVATDACRRAVTEALARRGAAGRVTAGAGPGTWVVRPDLTRPGLVSVIIPTRDGIDYLDTCLGSILERSTWTEFELVVVDNGSTSPRFFAGLEAWRRRDPRIRSVPSPGPFNFSRVIRDGAAASRGDYLLLLNDDTEVLTPDWLEAMMEQAQRPEVGAVGAKLLYPDGTIQHAGVFVGAGGVAAHLFTGLDRHAPGAGGAAQALSNYSAVTAACLMVRRELFDAVGGLDETFSVNFGDTDFCLRLGRSGHRTVYLPHVELVHHESASRGDPQASPVERDRQTAEGALFAARWPDAVAADPFISPRASRRSTDLTPL